MLIALPALATNQSTGEIYRIDLEKHTLVIAIECDCGSGRISDTNFTLKSSTKVTLNGKESKLADLKRGDMVFIDYEKTDDVQKIAATRDN